MSKLKTVAIFLALAAAVALTQYLFPRQSVAEEPRRFASKQQLAEYIRSAGILARFGYDYQVRELSISGVVQPMTRKEAAAGSPAMSADVHSTTNVQVEGVDEADVVKNDGKYLYVVSGRQVHILEAYPPERARLLSTIRCDGRPSEMLLNGSRLVVISGRSTAPGTAVTVYDISDPANPAEVRRLAWEGGFTSSRMIGNYAYLVINMPVAFEGDDVRLPRLTENNGVREVPPEEIYYFDCPDYSYRYTLIVAVNTAGDEGESSLRTILTGASQNVYASPGNLYFAGPKAPDPGPLIGGLIEGLASLVGGETAAEIRTIGSSGLSPEIKISRVEQVLQDYLAGLDYAGAAALEEKTDWLRRKFYRDLARERDKTVIYKFSLQGPDVRYRCRGEVNGKLLNQFSMDEAGGYFRAATTSEAFILSERPVTRNNIYVMDENLNVVGRLEGLAPTERIYSARFMGSRAYLVTFRRIDPLFVIDLKNPESPRVLGELKIPGYSDYLHPYDDNHLIGVGKELDPGPEPAPLLVEPFIRRPELIPLPPVRPQGVKISLFDVSNPARPVEISKYVVDHPYSDSEVSRNHRAFLFSRTRNLVALPVSYPEMGPASGEKLIPPLRRPWQGMYVFSVSPAGGISLRGKISHPPAADGRGYDVYDPVKRAAYIQDVFYTVSDGAVKLSRIEDLREIKLIRLPQGVR